jgi:carboxypeptidase C (cathepsin A)
MASETTPILQRHDYDAQDLPASISSASVHKELSAGKIAAVAFTLFTMLFLIVLFAHHNGGLAAPEAGKWIFNGASYEGTFSSRRVFHPKSHKGYSEIDDRLCDPNVESEAGYYRINGLGEKNYFYWFFESRRSPRDDPVVIWLTGGPGCSSQMALFAENGPCTVNSDAQDTTNNPYSWTDRANVIWIDQPADVGFSYNTKDPEHKYLDKDEDEVAEDMYHFLLAWFKGHPQFHRNQFYIFGESYAGHYIPAVSHRVYEGNRKLEGVHINLVGLGIGNGMTNPAVQFKHYADFAFNNTHRRIISQATYDRMKVMEGGCTALIEACQLDKLKCAG